MRTATTWTLGVLGLGGAGGVAWATLAEPPRWQVTEAGTVLTQPAVAHQFGVVMLFVAIGAGVGLLAGGLAGLVLRRLGWRLVPLVVAATAGAAVLAWRVGLLLGPPDPATVPATRVGETIAAQLVVDAVPAFIVWPLAGLLGLLAATWLGPARREEREQQAVGSA